MFELPVSVIIDDKEYPIRNRGDFRMVLDCFEALNDSELDTSSRILTSLIIFYDGITSMEDVHEKFQTNLETAVLEMYKFFNCGSLESSGQQSKHKLVDWKQDEQLIVSAINNVANKEIRLESYIHWWTFMGYYMSVGESAFSTVINIRSKIKNGKKLERHEKEFRRDNPQYFMWDSQSVEDKQLDSYIKDLWEKGG